MQSKKRELLAGGSLLGMARLAGMDPVSAAQHNAMRSPSVFNCLNSAAVGDGETPALEGQAMKRLRNARARSSCRPTTWTWLLAALFVSLGRVSAEANEPARLPTLQDQAMTAARPGTASHVAQLTRDDVLSIKNERFFLDGKPFAEISFNKFDLF